MAVRIYGYGIVDKNMSPWWGDDWCVCEDRHILEDECKNLNEVDDERTPYSVVALYFRKSNGDQDHQKRKRPPKRERLPRTED